MFVPEFTLYSFNQIIIASLFLIIIIIVIIIITSNTGKSNFTYFTLYKASSLNLKLVLIIW